MKQTLLQENTIICFALVVYLSIAYWSIADDNKIKQFFKRQLSSLRNFLTNLTRLISMTQTPKKGRPKSLIEEYYKEQADLFRKYRLLPEKYTGQVVLIITDGVIRNALRGSKPQPIKVDTI